MGDDFGALKGYLGDGSLLDCAEPNSDPFIGSRGLVYRTIATYPDAKHPTRSVMVPAEPRPGTVVGYCPKHAHGPWDSRYGGSMLRTGTYPFVREDTSASLARSEAVRGAFYNTKGWYDEPQPPTTTSWILRFPGEPWPPNPER